jgi:ribonucleoside-diphosphate reductase alpha chain
MRWLASRYCDEDLQEELGIMTDAVRARKTAEEAGFDLRGDTAGPSNGNGNGNGATAKAPEVTKIEQTPSNGKNTVPAAEAIVVDQPTAAPARLSGLDLGPACGQCGGMMQRTGSCYTCSSCGNNTGCG